MAEKWQPGRKNCVSWWAQVIPHRGTVLGNKMNILLLLPSLYQREQQRVTTPPPLWWTSGTLPRAFNTWVSVQFIYYFVLVTWWIGLAGPGPRTDQADGFGTVTMSVRLSCRSYPGYLVGLIFCQRLPCGPNLPCGPRPTREMCWICREQRYEPKKHHLLHKVLDKYRTSVQDCPSPSVWTNVRGAALLWQLFTWAHKVGLYR